MQNTSANNSKIFAENFSKMPLTGTRWLVFRDVPELVQKYVDGTKTLDYGCGAGTSTSLLKSLGLDVDGIDINEDMLEYAKQVDPLGNYTIIKSGEIPKADNYYDFVFSSFVFMYISTKEELQKVVGEIARVLKRGGMFITMVGSEDASKYDWYSINTQFEENKNVYSGSRFTIQWKGNDFLYNCYYWTQDDYRNIMDNSGLRTLCIHSPVGKDTDGYAWVTEKERPICDIYITRKDF